MHEPPKLPPQLDALSLTVVVDNESDSLSTVGHDSHQVAETTDLMGRLEPGLVGDGHLGVQVFDHLCLACHGLSVLVTARAGDREHTVLFDTGPRGEVWLTNAAQLGLDLGAIEAIVLSHWHWDHSGGLPGVVAAIAAARSATGAPPPIVDVHPDRPDQRGGMTANGMLALLPPEPTLDAIAAAGAVVELHIEQHLIAGGLVLVSGEIPRTTSYETGLPGHHSIRAGVVEPDPLIAEERLLAAHVAGRGVTVISACSHAGIVNACLHAIDTFRPAPIDVVLGGYHLAGGTMEGRIDETVADLLTLVDPILLAPGHCTGWRAKAALATTFGPQRYGPSVVGTRFHLDAAGDAAEHGAEDGAEDGAETGATPR